MHVDSFEADLRIGARICSKTVSARMVVPARSYTDRFMSGEKKHSMTLKHSTDSAAPSNTTATPQTIRLLNRSIVMNLIARNQPISRAGLARLTGMHRSNISIIVEGLIREGLLREEPAKPLGKGRIPLALFVREDSISVLAVSLRVSETTIALGRLTGKIAAQISFPTPSDADSFVVLLDKEIRGLLKRTGVDGRRSVLNLNISVPGHLRPKSSDSVWIPALPGYSGFRLRTLIESKTRIPTAVMNNAGIGALAELWLEEKEHPHPRDFVFLFVGDMGTGSGLILNQQLYLGHDRTFAGEFGHTVIEPNGPLCACGRLGCWQLYVSDHATWQRYQPKKPFSAANFREFLHRVRQQEARALACLFDTARYMALGIYNISQVLNPGSVVVGGEITGVWDVFELQLRKHLAKLDSQIPVRPSRIRNIDELFLHGAVQLGLRSVFGPPSVIREKLGLRTADRSSGSS